MADKVYVLMVDGGEENRMHGVYGNIEALETAITSIREENGYTEDNGFLRAASEEIGEDGATIVYIYEDGCEPFDFTLAFSIYEHFIIN